MDTTTSCIFIFTVGIVVLLIIIDACRNTGHVKLPRKKEDPRSPQHIAYTEQERRDLENLKSMEKAFKNAQVSRNMFNFSEYAR